MILGQINAFRPAIILVSVRDAIGQATDYSATIDTGFSGFLTLAPEVISALNLPFVEMRQFTLGDGSDIEMRLYRAVVIWDGHDRTVLAVEADDDALVGMEMLEKHTLFMDIRENGEVRIEPLP